MTAYLIGIDTGGTYTDAVLIEQASRRIVATAKAITTKGDLTVGITEALSAVIAERPEAAGAVATVALSTTLATNALVEGHGDDIAVLLIGFDADMVRRTGIAAAIPTARVIMLAGGHDHAGNETAAFDAAVASDVLAGLAGKVAAVAIAARYSVRNPAHEHAAGRLVAERLAVPSSLSSDLAQDLDAPRRALTAALNARIIGRIRGLIDAVHRAMQRHGIAAPLMIVRGDGALARAEAIADRPIETILSGPAASTIGARFLAGRTDFVLSDIGGTTTDIAIMEDGRPRLDSAGAEVGGRRTMVRAIDMRTHGLGGDTAVDIDAGGRVLLETTRIVPLSLLASRYPQVLDVMAGDLAAPDHVPHAGRFALPPFGSDRRAVPADLSARERDLIAAIGDGPVPIGRLIHSPTAERALRRLKSLGLVQLAGLTPSDAAHILGRQSQWTRQGAVLGAALLLRWRQMLAVSTLDETPMRALAERIVDAVVGRSARLIISALAGRPLAEDDPLAAAAVTDTGNFGRLTVRLQPTLPIVAVGGPATVYYREVARRLGCEVILPEHGAVANAVGAAVGTIRVHLKVEVTMPGPGLWRVHAGDDPPSFQSPAAAIALAETTARHWAEDRARAAGAAEPQVEIFTQIVRTPGIEADHGIIAATVTADSWGESGL